jgi:mono/diheme cytochrome c family protein
MSRYRKNLYKIFASLLVVALVSFNNQSFAQDGEALFKANCANCHHPLEDRTGPHLKDARKREPNADWVYKWVYHTNEMVVSDPYAKALKEKYGSVMTQQSESQISKKDIEAILDYADKFTPPVDTAKLNPDAPKEDNSPKFCQYFFSIIY